METLRTLPGDDVRQILWRFADRYDLQMAIQSARSVARGPVARLVAEGARNTHEWTEAKASLLKTFDESGITAVFLDPEYGGFIEGPKNMALALVALSCLGWMRERPHAVWRATSRCRRFTNAERPSNERPTWAAALRELPAKSERSGAGRLA